MMGYKFNEESAKFKGDKMTAIYLADEDRRLRSTSGTEISFIFRYKIVIYTA